MKRKKLKEESRFLWNMQERPRHHEVRWGERKEREEEIVASRGESSDCHFHLDGRVWLVTNNLKTRERKRL